MSSTHTIHTALSIPATQREQWAIAPNGLIGGAFSRLVLIPNKFYERFPFFPVACEGCARTSGVLAVSLLLRGRIIQSRPLALALLWARTNVVLPHTSTAQLNHPNLGLGSFLSSSLACD